MAYSDGPVVIVVIDPYDSQALVVRDEPAQPVEVVRLPDLTVPDAIRHISELDKARRATSDANLPRASASRPRKKYLEAEAGADLAGDLPG